MAIISDFERNKPHNLSEATEDKTMNSMRDGFFWLKPIRFAYRKVVTTHFICLGRITITFSVKSPAHDEIIAGEEYASYHANGVYE